MRTSRMVFFAVGSGGGAGADASGERVVEVAD
jgi:hypothetical protein